MILSLAVVLGLIIALVRYRKDALTQISALPIRYPWVILLAIILQIPLLRAPAVLPGQIRSQQALALLSYVILMIFILLNLRITAFWLVGAGIAANLLVMVINGGFMPVSPQTLERINPGTSAQDWAAGIHYPGSKDLVMLKEETCAWVLSDIFTVPGPYPFAFSLGDVLIAAGIISLLANLAPVLPVKNRELLGS